MKAVEVSIKDWLDMVITKATALGSLTEAVASAHVSLKRNHIDSEIIIPSVPASDAREIYTWCQEEDIDTNLAELSS